MWNLQKRSSVSLIYIYNVTLILYAFGDILQSCESIKLNRNPSDLKDNKEVQTIYDSLQFFCVVE